MIGYHYERLVGVLLRTHGEQLSDRFECRIDPRAAPKYLYPSRIGGVSRRKRSVALLLTNSAFIRAHYFEGVFETRIGLLVTVEVIGAMRLGLRLQ
jgi:hypothetical protein